MSETMGALEGSCHCGAVRVALHLPDAETSLSPRHCGCDFCRRHGGLYVSAPAAKLDIAIANSDAVNRYRFGHGTADFLVCKTCGVFPAVLSEIEGHLYAVVNANALDPPITVEEGGAPVADYESENVSDRLDRRRQRWIGNVTIREGGA